MARSTQPNHTGDSNIRETTNVVVPQASESLSTLHHSNDELFQKAGRELKGITAELDPEDVKDILDDLERVSLFSTMEINNKLDFIRRYGSDWIIQKVTNLRRSWRSESFKSLCHTEQWDSFKKVY